MILPTKEQLRAFCFELDDVVNNATQARSDTQIVDYVQDMLTKFWTKYELSVNDNRDTD